MPEKMNVEFIAIFLLAPLVWTSLGTSQPTPVPGEQGIQPVAAEAKSDMARPVVESSDGQLVIRPPRDTNLNLTVLELREGRRGPATTEGLTPRPTRTIEVIVSAP